MKNYKKEPKSINKKTAVKAAVSKKNKNNKTTMYVLIGVMSFLLALTVAIGVIYTYSKPQIDNENPFENTPGISEDNPDDHNRPVSVDGRKREMYNLLVVGKDYWSGSTDVIMLVSINTAKNSISVMQLPRDSTVDCGVNENHGKRVNAIYAYARSALRSIASNPPKEYDDDVMAKVAPVYISSLKEVKTASDRAYNDQLLNKMGLEYLKETLKKTFCIAIDGYVMVDVAGFREIVDVLGGVEVDVPQDMHYEDEEQNLYIHINKGLQVLDGKEAEGFVRFRHGYVDGDLGRVNAQKIFLAALAKKAMSFSTITKIQPLIETCFEYTTTNLTTTDIIGYAKILLGMDLSNIKFYTVPGEAYLTSSGASYYSLYMDETLQIINEFFNDYDRQVTPNDVTLRQVVKNYNITYNHQGITAEQLDNSELKLNMSSVSYNPVPEDTSSQVNGGEDDEDSVETSAPVEDEPTEDTHPENNDSTSENEDMTEQNEPQGDTTQTPPEDVSTPEDETIVPEDNNEDENLENTENTENTDDESDENQTETDTDTDGKTQTGISIEIPDDQSITDPQDKE